MPPRVTIYAYHALPHAFPRYHRPPMSKQKPRDNDDSSLISVQGELLPLAPGDDFGDEGLETEALPPLSRPEVGNPVARALRKAFEKPRLDAVTWLEEVRAIGQAAAISREFNAATKCYEMIAPSLGVMTKQTEVASQHLHLHNAEDIHELSPQELREEIERRKKRQRLAQLNKQASDPLHKPTSGEDYPEGW